MRQSTRFFLSFQEKIPEQVRGAFPVKEHNFGVKTKYFLLFSHFFAASSQLQQKLALIANKSNRTLYMIEYLWYLDSSKILELLQLFKFSNEENYLSNPLRTIHVQSVSYDLSGCDSTFTLFNLFHISYAQIQFYNTVI